MRYFTLFFVLILLKTSMVFSHQYYNYEEYGRQRAKNYMLKDLLNRIEYLNSEISHMDAYDLKSEKYYFFVGAHDFYSKYYSLIYHDD